VAIAMNKRRKMSMYPSQKRRRPLESLLPVGREPLPG
jgi:hypothetical protein